MIEPLNATYTKNKKHKREVCRYWLQSRCLKGNDCEFIHTVDHSKMPVCPMGDSCLNINDCSFQHLSSQRTLCANYQIGFCSFGRRCRHRHEELGPDALKAVSVYFSDSYSAINYAKDTAQANHNFRKAKCEYFSLNGWCPYFDMCNFSH
jgi:hypothetical protein